MKTIIRISMLLIVLTLLSGCSEKNVNEPANTATQPPAAAAVPEMTEPVAQPTEPVTETVEETEQTEPIEPTEPALGILAGSYRDHYLDEENGYEMDYYIHIPENAVEGMPLFIFLHGDGEVGKYHKLKNQGMMSAGRSIYGEEYPFIGLSPSTKIESWISGDIPETLKALIDHVVELYSIDQNRIIITGHSRGAIGVWNMISIYGDYFAGAVPVSSPHQKDHINFPNCALVPVWSFAGNIGETELWYHQWLQYNTDVINRYGGWAKFTVLNGCNHGITQVEAFTAETFNWMLEQTNKEESDAEIQ